MAEPSFADTREDGNRWYVLNSEERFLSVSTALGIIATYGIPDWSARLTAEAAVERLDWLTKCSEVDACNETKTEDACGSCKACAIYWLSTRHTEYRDAAGDRGTRLHEATEHLELFGGGGTVDEDIAPMYGNYQKWFNHYKPEVVAAEMTVVSRKWGYAGTLDNILKFGDDSPLPEKLEHLRGLNLVIDKKSGKHVGLKESWQVTAYSRADVAVLDDGTEQDMPAIGGGLILHVRPDRIQMREVHTTDTNFANFIHALRLFEAVNSPLGSGLSRPINLPKAGKKLWPSLGCSSSKPRWVVSAWV